MIGLAISNELSSEIAVALLAEKKPPALRRRKEVILKVHTVLQEMAGHEQRRPEQKPHEDGEVHNERAPLDL